MLGWLSAEAERASCSNRRQTVPVEVDIIGKDLQRHAPSQLHISRDIDLAHAARAKRGDELWYWFSRVPAARNIGAREAYLKCIVRPSSRSDFRYGNYKSGTQSNRRIPSHHYLQVSCATPSGQKLAYVWPVSYLVFLGVFVAWGYSLYSGRFPRLGVLGGLLLGAAATLAAYDGTTRAQREYASTHDGRLTPGVVVAQIDPTKANTPRVPGRRRLRRDLETLTIEGSRLHDVLGRLILTGSPRAWSIEYRYECERPRGCYGRDIVPEALWRRLYPGKDQRAPAERRDRLEPPRRQPAVGEGDVGPDDCRGAVPGRGRRLGPTEATPAPVLDGAGGGDGDRAPENGRRAHLADQVRLLRFQGRHARSGRRIRRRRVEAGRRRPCRVSTRSARPRDAPAIRLGLTVFPITTWCSQLNGRNRRRLPGMWLVRSAQRRTRQESQPREEAHGSESRGDLARRRCCGCCRRPAETATSTPDATLEGSLAVFAKFKDLGIPLARNLSGSRNWRSPSKMS